MNHKNYYFDVISGKYKDITFTKKDIKMSICLS